MARCRWRDDGKSVAYIGRWFGFAIFNTANKDLKFDAASRQGLKEPLAISALDRFVIDRVAAKLPD